MGTRYLAMDIGCIECGEASAVIGVYLTREDADAAIRAWVDDSLMWRRAGRLGQHSEEVFEIEVP